MNEQNKELLKLECKSCGSHLEMTDETHARCTHCNQIYLIDELEHELFAIQVDYGDNTSLKKTLSTSRKALLISVPLALVVLIIIFCLNIGAVTSVFSSADSDQDLAHNGYLIKIFCEDIFQKPYDQITPEEFASVKYIKTSHNPETNSSEFYHTIEYSFTDYKNCTSEEEFQETIQKWSHSSRNAYPWIDDYTMFTGLTRIDTREDRLGLGEIQFADNCPISYVDTLNSPLCVAETLNPENIKVLHAKLSHYGPEGLDRFPNLEELASIGTYYYDEDEAPMDIRVLGACKNLRILKLDCANGYTGTEALTGLSSLESVSLKYTLLSDCGFLKDLPSLKELHIYSGDEPDLTQLSQLPKLEKLDFMDDEDIPVEALCTLTNLTELTADFEDTHSLKKLTSLSKLEKLDVAVDAEFGSYHDGIVYDLSPLAELPSIKDLCIRIQADEGHFIGLTELLNIDGLSRFAFYCEYYGGRLLIPLDTEMLDENPELQKLTFSEPVFTSPSSGEITDYSFLTKYKNLKELTLSGCNISGIDFVSALPELEMMAFWESLNSSGNNDLTDYSPLLSCRKLKTLYVDSKDQLNVTFPQDVEIWDREDFYTI